MAEAMTYDSLMSDIQVYAERTDDAFVSQIPRFIMLAENRLASEIHGLGYRRIVSANFVVGNPIIAKPVRWRETAEFSFVDAGGTRQYLYQRYYGYLRMFWPTSATSEPKYYADYDYEHFLVAPNPSDDFPFELHYHERPEPLDATNQTSWTTRYAPHLLLYASLLEAQPFLMRPERTQEFLNLYQLAAQQIEREGQLRIQGDQTNARSQG